MALDTSIIVEAMTANLPSPTAAQMSAINAFANAIKEFVEGATIIYTSGLTTAAGGGPVTGTFAGTIE